ncbi:MAG: putative sensor protein [Candidatus Eremiobacteraeota bacterium]|jgi:PAS domain S-box-containing protein|nr:putative sensor protein [Candidatus Eremiobacteraeota bacterium]
MTDAAGEVHFRELVEESPAAVFVARADGSIAYVNRAWTTMSGITADVVQRGGWVEAIHPDDAGWVAEAWRRSIARAEPFREEFRIRDGAGDPRWVISEAIPVFRADGAVTTWYGTVLDVDARRTAEHARAILARLGNAFVESLDFVRTARTVVTAMCEDFADFAFLDVLDAGGRLERVAAETARLHSDPEPFRRFAPPPEPTQHPISVAMRTGLPSIVTACDDAWIARTASHEEDAALLRSLGIGTIAYVPMIAAGERIGVLTFGTARGTGRSFSSAELGDLEEVARRAAVALANARLYADLAASEARYRGIIDTAQEGVWILDGAARTRYVNHRLTELLGYTADEMYDRPVSAFLDDDEAARSRIDYVTVRTERAPIRAERRLRRKDGTAVWAILAASPILDANGEFAGTLGMLTDITDRKAIETQYRLLAEATPQIVWTADPRGMITYLNERWTALTGMTRTDALGYGWCAVVHEDDLVQLSSGWRSARDAGADFEAECRLRSASDATYRWQLVRARARRDERGAVIEWLGSMTDVDATRRMAKMRDVVARAGDVLNRQLDVDGLLDRFAELLVEELADEVTIRLPGGRAFVHSRRSPPEGSPALQAVIRHRGTELGTVTLRDCERFDYDDASLLDELSARAGVAIENALLYEREHRVAVTLQRALLPAVLPTVAGLTFDAVYFPGATDAEIGGDWYDAIELPDGRVLVSIGDVTGRGLTAAVIMGRVRQAIETLATYESDPVRLLDSTDAVLRRAYPNAIVTALVGVIDPPSGTMTYATAGHPTPFVRAADGTVRSLPGRGLPLGLREGRHQPATTIVLPPSALLVFFTDGLTEATRDIDEGERRVRAALSDVTVAAGRDPAARLVARVLDEAIRDDVAVLTVRLSDALPVRDAWTVRWSFDAREARRAYDVRDAFSESLASFGSRIDIPAAQLVFGELVGNAVRYASGLVDVEVSWEDPTAPVLVVRDDGPGFSTPGELPSAESETGRGLYLVSRLTRAFSVTNDPVRGARARAVLAASAPAEVNA